MTLITISVQFAPLCEHAAMKSQLKKYTMY